jgi:hypothetical protein
MSLRPVMLAVLRRGTNSLEVENEKWDFEIDKALEALTMRDWNRRLITTCHMEGEGSEAKEGSEIAERSELLERGRTPEE